MFLEKIECEQELLHDHTCCLFAYLLVVLDHVQECTLWLVLKDKVHIQLILIYLQESEHVLALIEGPMHFEFINELFKSISLLNNL